MTEVVRLTMRTESGGSCAYWAMVISRKKGVNIFREIKKTGERMMGKNGDTINYILANDADIVSEKPARLNGKYERMEVIK